MKKIILIGLVFISAFSNAQTFEKIISFSSGSNTNEYGNAGIELQNGNYLLGINNNLVCLSPNGDSLWSKTFKFYGDITKLFYDKNNQLIVATTFGKMLFMRINPNNGDTLSTFKVPQQFSNSGYTIYDAVILPDGDYVIAYNNGGGDGGVLRRFTPGSTKHKWSNDYAGQNFAPKSLYLDDTTIVFAAYKGVANYQYDLVVSKLSQSNSVIWTKQMKRNLLYKDRLMGIQKNSANNYLVATSWGINNKLLPAIAVIGNNGDSIAVHSLEAHKNTNINHGYLTSLSPAPNGFYASGYMNLDAADPNNATKSIGYMSAFSIADDGKITGSSAYNKIGFYELSANVYTGSEGWGNGCIKTSDGYYLLYGVGNRIYRSSPGASPQPQWRGYVAKANQFEPVSVAELGKNQIELTLFPNPVADQLTVFKNGGFNSGVLTVYNMLGETIHIQPLQNEAFVSFPVTNWSKGTYFLEYRKENNTQTVQFIKQ